MNVSPLAYASAGTRVKATGGIIRTHALLACVRSTVQRLTPGSKVSRSSSLHLILKPARVNPLHDQEPPRADRDVEHRDSRGLSGTLKALHELAILPRRKELTGGLP